jgi:hypothetical protein
MPSIFDLMPASLWPVQPFVPLDEQARTLVALQSQLAPRDPWTAPRLDPTPHDPTQASMWPSSPAPSWTVPAAPPFNWPTSPVDPPPYADASSSEWDRTMRQALVPSGAPRAPGIGDSASSQQMLADAKRAYDFARWTFGLPSAARASLKSTSMPYGATQDVGGTPPNFVAPSADTAQPPIRAPQADDVNAPLRPSAAEQQPDLGAAYGNRNLARQGARARAAAATRAPLAPEIVDFFRSIPRGVLEGLANTAADSGQAAQIEMQQPVDVPSGDEATDIVEQNITGQLPKPQNVGGHFGETVGQFLGNPMSYIGPGSLAAKLLRTIMAGLGSEAAGQLTQRPWAEPFARIGGGMLGGGAAASALERAPAAAEAVANAARNWRPVRGGMPRSATLPVEPIQGPRAGSNAEIAEPQVDPADVPLVPYDAESALAAARGRGIDLDTLLDRVREFHGVLDPLAQSKRTTAALLTDGPTIIAGGARKDLEKTQLRLLRDGEIYAKFPGVDAEVTALTKAMALSHRPRALAASRPFCAKCRAFIESIGGILTSDRTAVFPPF